MGLTKGKGKHLPVIVIELTELEFLCFFFSAELQMSETKVVKCEENEELVFTWREGIKRKRLQLDNLSSEAIKQSNLTIAQFLFLFN